MNPNQEANTSTQDSKTQQTFGKPQTLDFMNYNSRNIHSKASKNKKENPTMLNENGQQTSIASNASSSENQKSTQGTYYNNVTVADITSDPNEQLKAMFSRRADEKAETSDEPTTRQLISFYLNSSSLGRKWDQADAIVNLAMAILYIYMTTYAKKDSDDVPYYIFALDAFLAFILMLIYLPRYYVAADFRKYLFSLVSISSILTIISPFLVIISIYFDQDVYKKSLYGAGIWVFLYPVRFYRLQHALNKVLDSVKNVFYLNPVVQKALQSIATVVTTVFSVTVLTHIVIYIQRTKKESEVQDFGDVLFFTSVSSITGLRADVSPDDWFTRSVVVFIMFLGIIWLPPKMSEVLSMIKQRSPWDTTFSPEPNQRHVIVIGDLWFSSLFEFLREFFCEDHGPHIVNTVVVLMSENGPDNKVAALLKDPAYRNSVKFVLGSPTSFKDLAAVKAHRASSIFILGSKINTATGDSGDSHEVMTTLAIRRYLSGVNRKVPIYAQASLPETTLHLEYMTKEVICIPELRLGLLAQGVAVPGFSSLLQSLMTSIPDNMETQLSASVSKNPGSLYLKEYIGGLGQEIYPTKFSPVFHGMKFTKAVQYIYKNYNSILFALKVDPSQAQSNAANGSATDLRTKILINPSNYIINGTETGFIISTDSYIPLSIRSIPTNGVVSEGAEDIKNAKPSTSDPAPTSENDKKEGTESPEPVESSIADMELERPSKAKDSGEEIGSAEENAHEKEVEDFGKIDVEENSVASPKQESSSQQPITFTSPLVLGSTDINQALQVPEPIPSKNNKTASIRAGESTTINASQNISAHTDVHTEANQNKTISLSSQPSDLTSDGIPGDIKSHIVICSTSSSFPENMEYLVGSIRASKNSGYRYSPKNEDNKAETQGSNLPTEDSTSLVNRENKESWFGNFSFLPSNTGQNENSKESLGDNIVKENAFPNMQPIIFLSKGNPPSDVKALLESYEKVYFISGTPLVKSSLVRARVMTAASAIVLLSPSKANSEGSNTDLSQKTDISVASADAPSLLAVLNIESLTCNRSDFFLFVEMNYRENMQFIGGNTELNVNEAYIQSFFRPCFMSGHCYSPIMLDTLICQSFYNDDLISLLRNLIFSQGNITHEVEYSKMVAAGLSPSELPPIKPNMDLAYPNSSIFLVDIPEVFFGCPFSSVFLHYCFKENAVCIGLYRNSASVIDYSTKGANQNSGSELINESASADNVPLSNTAYFVANPSPTSILVPGDKAYILSSNFSRL
ncbi:hypothetical protein BB558_001021 [Smittium angustum]|uniref:RCK N-terminal domain-containing protein n=1 Tax=Smittium angustum TaxID=133377 RepID=A0A2U1JCJ7_SMIAN|nr:hypothetical protein BB558_001021 [Smittium angustum]